MIPNWTLKQISTALLDYAKYFELIGDKKRALKIMTRIRQQGNVEWKVQFDAVVMLKCWDGSCSPATFGREMGAVRSVAESMWAMEVPKGWA